MRREGRVCHRARSLGKAKLETASRPGYAAFMNKKPNPADRAKAARLAAALRENLKRRKEQARARAGKPVKTQVPGGKAEPGGNHD